MNIYENDQRDILFCFSKRYTRVAMSASKDETIQIVGENVSATYEASYSLDDEFENAYREYEIYRYETEEEYISAYSKLLEGYALIGALEFDPLQIMAGELTPLENANDYFPISPEEAVDLVYNKLSEKNKLIENAEFIYRGLIEYNGAYYYWVGEYGDVEGLSRKIQTYFANAVTGEIYLDYDATLYRLSAGERFPEFKEVFERFYRDGTRLIKIE